MKTCNNCGEQKPKTEFNKKKRRPDGLQQICRPCERERNREYYSKNKERMKKQINEARKKRSFSIKQEVFEYLLEHPCVDCGETDPRVLDFDHLRDKDSDIAAMLSGVSGISKIREEIDKCEVRCANCHRIKTSIEFNWYKHLMYKKYIDNTTIS
tara:strand:- start:75 stop:539 length:465 start_codon:yes stop_codon:yes gene_type:complete